MQGGPAILLVSGIPGTGKSTFCGWVKREKGFIHLEFDKLLEGKGSSEELSLMAILNSRGSRAFVDELRKLDKKVAVEWGFHPNNLPQVREMVEAGAEAWWFDGDRPAAREAFRNVKGAAKLPAFDQQVARIAAAWTGISALFQSRILKVVRSGPSHVTPEQIWQEMERRKAASTPLTS